MRESEEKRVEPTQVLNCVGTLVDAKNRVMKVLPERQMELLNEIDSWKSKQFCTLKDVQRLVSKLQFLCAVVRPGRIFLARLLEFLRSLNENDRVRVSVEFRKDLEWWRNFLPTFQGESILWMCQVKEPDMIGAGDSSLKGMGAVCGKQYVKLQFPEELANSNIAYLKLLAVVVMVKIWLPEFLW